MFLSLPLIPILRFLIKNKKFLMCLLSLEIVALSLIILVLFIYLKLKLKIFILIILILTFRACEARIGLSLIVLISRSFGSDKLIKISTSKC